MAHEQTATPEICYAMAYFVLPHYVFNQVDQFIGRLNVGDIGAGFFYVMTCKMNEQEPRDDLIGSFRVHNTTINDRDCYVISYPTPPAVDISSLADDQVESKMATIVLAPYFSAVLRNQQNGDVQYFVLGQSPGGGTTFRRVTPQANANLGPGCEPELESFLALLTEKT